MVLQQRIAYITTFLMGFTISSLLDYNSQIYSICRCSKSTFVQNIDHTEFDRSANLRMINTTMAKAEDVERVTNMEVDGRLIDDLDQTQVTLLEKEYEKLYDLPISSNNDSEINQDTGTQSKIDKLLHAISILSRLNLQSPVMTSVRKTMGNFSEIPELSLDLAKSSRRGLLGTIVPPTARIVYNDTWRGFPLPVMTCTPLGRQGNVMGEYATLYALKHLYNVSVVINRNMKQILRKYFSNLSLPDLPGEFVRSNWEGVSNFGGKYNYAPIEIAAAGLLGPRKFMMKEYAFEIQLFQGFRKEIRQEFTILNSLKRKIATAFREISANISIKFSDAVFVGIHVRRTDYLRYVKNNYKISLPEDAYFRRAINYYRDKFPGRVTFIAASDDFSFIKEKLGNFSDVYFSPGSSPEIDMAMLSSCNHSIITLGSFGFWTGFLTGGEVIYPDIEFDQPYRFSRKMFESVGLQDFKPLPIN